MDAASRKTATALPGSSECKHCGAGAVNLGLNFCQQSAVTMWLGAGLAGRKLTLLPWTCTTGRTTDSEYLLWAEFFFRCNRHDSCCGRNDHVINPSIEMVNLE